MSNLAIEVENLSKAYQLGQFNTGALAYDLKRWWALKRGKEDPFLKIGETNDRTSQGESNVVWSLKDINFQIEQGSAVGIIGRNGAGKSTLLKVLSSITSPTSGQIKINGRIASLLEVGTGFHPELTGRENIYLNGAILGMRKHEIKRKFDEIVEFSGVARYIDTPVKRYSSGMYVRLAFAVAAHLESEILIVDEVLAVGDAEFQTKCLGKMSDISHGDGRTILFVSHNLSAIKQLCNKGILLQNGSIKMDGDINTVIENYAYTLETEKTFSPIKVREIGVTISKISLNSDEKGVVLPYKPLVVDIELDGELDENIKVGIEIMISHEDTSGFVFASNSKTKKNIEFEIKKGKNVISCLIHNFNLCSGKYRLGFGISLQLIKYYYYNTDLLSFDVPETIESPSLLPTLPIYGHVYLEHEWTAKNI
ncbi:polysaccharide ABC transporter ATP-binding protein [Mucilaginibacter sp. UYCu711]|uniref:ABC transporter ATP-binding protein n=1 Tax=Mucilaginibacter sp. UYCu711 TaxID=3156339 RepID=UPI003D1BD106